MAQKLKCNREHNLRSLIYLVTPEQKFIRSKITFLNQTQLFECHIGNSDNSHLVKFKKKRHVFQPM